MTTKFARLAGAALAGAAMASLLAACGGDGADDPTRASEWGLRSPQATQPAFTVGADTRVPVPWAEGVQTYYINDSVFPYVRAGDGKGYVAFWGAGAMYRYAGADLWHLAPSPGPTSVTYAPGVDHSRENGWDANGDWMLTASRAADGSLVAFVHGENHVFADGHYGEWNSSGVLVSRDDGLSWTNYGQIVGAPKPDRAQYGGWGLTEVIWDPMNQRWLGYAGNVPFVSYDPHGMPGTWYGYYKGSFGQHIDVTRPMPPLSGAPGLSGQVTWGGLTYNTYLHKFILTWMNNGDTHGIHASFSADGTNWGPVVVLFNETADHSASYPQIIGSSDTTSGQDAYLVYNRSPGTYNRRDIVTRPIHFQ